ncbi:MAG: substrate-binding domain-containing protein [Chloroflexi bacterium]|nr:substrate-binding domain-containing protein [Chloroflexota bacterium]
MPQTTRRSALGAGSLILVASLATGGAAIAQEPVTAPEPPTGLTGSITISGSSTVQPISTAVQELFNVGSPGVAISVDGPGTGDGFALFCAGETDIADASRAIRPSEAETCAANGVEHVELKVALDGLSVITSANNQDLTCLSFNDLYALVGPESIGFGRWSDAQAIATELGSTTVFPDAALTITGPGEESGTYDFFVEVAIAPIAEARGQEAFTRPDYQASANDLTIVEGVAGTVDAPDTLGWVGFAFVEENLDRIKPLAVDGGAGCIEPTYDVISDGTYPISRPLFIYVNTTKAAEKPELAAFVDYYLAPGVIESVLQTVPYVGLSAEETQVAADAWANR